jgi:hypothetical protein
MAAAWLMIALSSADTRATKRSLFRVRGRSKVAGMFEMCTKVAHKSNPYFARLHPSRACYQQTG